MTTTTTTTANEQEKDQFLTDFELLFGASQTACDWNLMRRKAWIGSCLLLPSGPQQRAMVWRVFLGLVPYSTGANKTKNLMEEWKEALNQQVIDYTKLKSENVVKLDQVSADPLSNNSNNNKQNDEWSAYYKYMELTQFIKGDLDRLYMNGIADDYFETAARRDVLSMVLTIWSLKNPAISYRQGMHEIVGILLFVLERELEAWTNINQLSTTTTTTHPLASSFTSQTLEAHLYWLFERTLKELSVLYDPVSVSGGGGNNFPPIVHFCTRVQEHFLSQLDPDLCIHLEDCAIPGQLYGMKWCRLLFSREFPVTHTLCLRIWDYIFACCLEQYIRVEDMKLLTDGEPAEAETLALVLKARYQPYTPMLAAIGDFMIALLLQIRGELLEGDANAVMCLLMRFPTLTDVTPILDIADMVRRGVLIEKAHLFLGEQFNEDDDDNNNNHDHNNGGNNNGNNNNGGRFETSPAWLLKGLPSLSVKKMAERLSRRSLRGTPSSTPRKNDNNNNNNNNNGSAKFVPKVGVASNNNNNNNNQAVGLTASVDSTTTATTTTTASEASMFDDPLRFFMATNNTLFGNSDNNNNSNNVMSTPVFSMPTMNFFQMSNNNNNNNNMNSAGVDMTTTTTTTAAVGAAATTSTSSSYQFSSPFTTSPISKFSLFGPTTTATTTGLSGKQTTTGTTTGTKAAPDVELCNQVSRQIIEIANEIQTNNNNNNNNNKDGGGIGELSELKRDDVAKRLRHLASLLQTTTTTTTGAASEEAAATTTTTATTSTTGGGNSSTTLLTTIQEAVGDPLLLG